MMEVGKISNDKPLVFSLSAGYILTALIIAYFYFFPTLANPLFSDSLIVLGVLLLLSSLIYASVRAQSSREVILVLLATTLLSIVARSIPHLRLAYPPLADPYYYAISALNIIEHGTLQPILGDWYTGVNAHLHWPVMHLFTAITTEIIGIDSMWFIRFQQPLLGGIFVLIVFALAKEATKNNTIALLSALVASASDVVIYYQSEYHPQGFAVVFFVLFVYIYLKSRTTGRLRYHVLTLVCLAFFLLSHHFSSLFVALLAISFIGLNTLISVLPRRVGQITQVAREVRADNNLWTIIAVAGIAYHFMVYFSPVRGFLLRAAELEAGAGLVAAGAGIPPLLTLLNLAKWGILLLAAPSIVRVIRAPQPHELRLLVLLACILFAGFIANYILWGPVDRMITFYSPLVSVFVATTVHQLFTLKQIPLQRRTEVIKAATVFTAGLLLTAGFFNGSHIPALYFKSSQVNSYYWYSNLIPQMAEHKAAGEWTGMYIPDNLKIGTDWNIRTVPFFFGKRSTNNVISPVNYPTASADYIMPEPSIPQGDEKPAESEYDRDLSVIYNNGELKIYKLPR